MVLGIFILYGLYNLYFKFKVQIQLSLSSAILLEYLFFA